MSKLIEFKGYIEVDTDTTTEQVSDYLMEFAKSKDWDFSLIVSECNDKLE